LSSAAGSDIPAAMNNLKTRVAVTSEFDLIYLMGADAWAEGSKTDYLTTCRTSLKYKNGTWYVLADDIQIFSSLIVYSLAEGQLGIGSISTPISLRKQGHASQLLSEVIHHIEVGYPGATIFLYSDIEPKFYEKFKFVQLPPIAQRYKTTVCMVRGQNNEKLFSDKLLTPEYF
jgi:predicted acetyltransferase